MEDLELSEDESGTDDSGINEDKMTNNTGVKNDKGGKSGSMCDGSVDKSTCKEVEGETQQQQTALSFLEQLDARIKSSKKESEKLR